MSYPGYVILFDIAYGDSFVVLVWATGYASTAHSSQKDSTTQRHNHFSTFDRAIWGQPIGSAAGMVMPQLSSNDFIASNPELRARAQDLARSASSPQTFAHEARTYTVSAAAVNLSDEPWRLYLLTDVSQDVAMERQLNLILTAAALLASLVTLMLNRRGIQRSLLPLRRFGDTLSAVRSSSLQQKRFEPDQEPDELQPLAHAFNALLISPCDLGAEPAIMLSCTACPH